MQQSLGVVTVAVTPQGFTDWTRRLADWPADL